MTNNEQERVASLTNVLSLCDSDTGNRIRAALQIGLVAQAFYDVDAPLPTALLTCWRNLLDDSNSDVRNGAIQSLSLCNPPECRAFVGAVSAIMDDQLTSGCNPWDAATILCQHGHEKGLRYFAQKLQATEVTVRENAILEILNIRDDSALCLVKTELVTALQDPAPIVRVGVAEGLWRLGHALDRLLPVLVSVLSHSANSAVQLAAGLVLCKMGPSAKSALPGLLALEESDSAPLRCLAVRAVTRLEAPADVTISLLRRCANDESASVSALAEFELRKRKER